MGFRETLLANSDAIRDLRSLLTATQSFCTTLADDVTALEENYDDRIRMLEETLLARIVVLEMRWTMIAEEVTSHGR